MFLSSTIDGSTPNGHQQVATPTNYARGFYGCGGKPTRILKSCKLHFSAVVVAFLNVQLPLTLGQLINVVSSLQPGIYCLQSIFIFSYITLLSVVGENCAIRMRTRLFQCLLEQDISFFDKHKTGELVNRLSGDVQDFKSSFKLVISQGLKSITQTIGCTISLFIISPQMTALVGVVVPVMIIIGTIIGSGLRQWSREAQSQVALSTAVADEALGNIRTVRAFAMEDKELSLYQQELEQARWFNQRLGYGIAGFQGLTNLAINGMVLLVITHGGLLLATNQITPGALMSFLVTTQTIQRSLANLSVLFGQIVRGMTAGSRVFEYIQLVHNIPVSDGHVIPSNELIGKVEFRNITFSYPSRPDQVVLNDFSLNLPPGQVTALCGLSGAGKSTVAALLERFYDPDIGSIYIDGCDLCTLDPCWIRGSVIGYINQEPVLFATSIMENIRYGRPSASDEEVYEAAKLAKCITLYVKFPAGYKTIVGERGVTLSGGQKQRVAIARALLKDPSILILDEATSALDTQSEKMVQEALDQVSHGRTVLVIAHRLSTIQDADNIAVIHEGKLKETGTHSTLLNKRGLYYELVRRQTLIDN
ncbi:LOW QUALITY PROTEIN: mitochondrial potassium channel ATP-binding subunit-like [Gigantopelta aegis]|uniref:LOW QUALITY PROTEIN: mitochondrial potassium channel ATP-binding subunit-like n=1 Tax=Gigantopelta aegis TaxID=1735272 RepID=UPI001B88D46F|nr:LOW QUALITY PROTEIN: mitochondrial potassium channel ATP-binding subunit-like [Gigantopelta aegis]